MSVSPEELLPCGHKDEIDCQDNYIRHDQPFESVKECVEYFLPYYKNCIRMSRDDIFDPILSHLCISQRENMLLEDLGNDFFFIQQLIDEVWESL